jgi:hypothetical protein
MNLIFPSPFGRGVRGEGAKLSAKYFSTSVVFRQDNIGSK